MRHKSDIDAVKYHLRNGVKTNDRDKTGKTVLLWAIRSKKHEVVYHLLDRGADPNIADQNKVRRFFGRFACGVRSWCRRC